MWHSIRGIRGRTALVAVICGIAASAISTAQTGRPSATALEMTAYSEDSRSSRISATEISAAVIFPRDAASRRVPPIASARPSFHSKSAEEHVTKPTPAVGFT
jgi:hypothetical protein